MRGENLKKISVRISHFEQIAVDSHAHELNISRSEFCRLAVQEKLSGAREIARERQQESDTKTILNVLNSLNNNILSAIGMVDEDSRQFQNIMGGFKTLCRGIVLTNPDKARELRRVFTNKEIWSKLEELGYKYV